MSRDCMAGHMNFAAAIAPGACAVALQLTASVWEGCRMNTPALANPLYDKALDLLQAWRQAAGRRARVHSHVQHAVEQRHRAALQRTVRVWTSAVQHWAREADFKMKLMCVRAARRRQGLAWTGWVLATEQSQRLHALAVRHHFRRLVSVWAGEVCVRLLASAWLQGHVHSHARSCIRACSERCSCSCAAGAGSACHAATPAGRRACSRALHSSTSVRLQCLAACYGNVQAASFAATEIGTQAPCQSTVEDCHSLAGNSRLPKAFAQLFEAAIQRHAGPEPYNAT